MVSNPRIGIVGGGFAGLYTVFFLRKFIPRGLDITLFDRNNYSLYTPVLHEMATGTVHARHVVIPIRKVVDPREVQIRCEEVIRVDVDKRGVETPSGTFTFDHLVLATGSEPNRGDMASLGFMFGVAEVYGWQFKGFPAWIRWKAFKLGMLPRLKNRFQNVADWMITLLFKRDTSKLV